MSRSVRKALSVCVNERATVTAKSRTMKLGGRKYRGLWEKKRWVEETKKKVGKVKTQTCRGDNPGKAKKVEGAV